MDRVRCPWTPPNEPLYVEYHDREWGVPLYDDHRLFEMLVLEGAQAGLSWLIVLRKRDAYRAAFDNFDPVKVAAYDEEKVAELLANPGIIRHRGKIEAAVGNARGVLAIQAEYGALAPYLWSFVDGRPIQNQRRALADYPAQTVESQRMSKELQRRGFKFVGPTIMYAFMQAVGMVNDHTVDCFRYVEVAEAAR